MGPCFKILRILSSLPFMLIFGNLRKCFSLVAIIWIVYFWLFHWDITILLTPGHKRHGIYHYILKGMYFITLLVVHTYLYSMIHRWLLTTFKHIYMYIYIPLSYYYFIYSFYGPSLKIHVVYHYYCLEKDTLLDRSITVTILSINTWSIIPSIYDFIGSRKMEFGQVYDLIDFLSKSSHLMSFHLSICQYKQYRSLCINYMWVPSLRSLLL